jgi:hypothetical protein
LHLLGGRKEVSDAYAIMVDLAILEHPLVFEFLLAPEE